MARMQDNWQKGSLCQFVNLMLEFASLHLLYSTPRTRLHHGRTPKCPTRPSWIQPVMTITNKANHDKSGSNDGTAAAIAAVSTTAATSMLVIEDDDNICAAVSEYFSRAGYQVSTAQDGASGVQSALNNRPDVVVLDLMLPKMDGLAVCKELRQKSPQMPIIMLTAKDDVVDRILGLEMGADDYITKPFSLRELEARIKSVLRRSRTAATEDVEKEAPIMRGKLRIDPARREVTIGDRQVELTPKEFDLLRLFASNPGRVFPRKYLLQKIWDYSYEGYDRTIDSHINRLRAKVEDNHDNPQMVLTVWGIGYKFSDEH